MSEIGGISNANFVKLPGVQEYLENLENNSNNSPKPRTKIINFNIGDLHSLDDEKLKELITTVTELRDKAGKNSDDINMILKKMYQDLLDDIEDELSDRNKRKSLKGRKSRKSRKARKARKTRRT